MLQDERINLIKEKLKDKKFVSVEELAAEFNMSAMSMRRDLKQLCDEGFAYRCHGGARLVQDTVPEVDYDVKIGIYADEKMKLAVKALSLIKPNDTLYLDSGTTTGALAKLLVNFGGQLAVVTNDLNIARILSDSSVNLTILGGTVHNQTKSIMGHGAETFMKQFRFSKAFLGAASINYNFDIFSPTYDKVHLKHLAFELSSEIYLMVDESKFYWQSMCYIESLSNCTGVITNKIFNEAERKMLDEMDINVISI